MQLGQVQEKEKTESRTVRTDSRKTQHKPDSNRKRRRAAI